MICEEVWGSDDSTPSNPFEIRITAGEIGSYGSYNSGLPVYDAEELQQNYSCVREFAKMAIEKRFCSSCRFPWIDRYRKYDCTCGQFEQNKEAIHYADVAATAILAYDRNQVLEWAKQIEKDLEGDSEYARLNRKARDILEGRTSYYQAQKAPLTFVEKVKKTLKKWFVQVTIWLRPSYWKWYFETPKVGKVKSIPLFAVTEEDIKSMSFGNEKVSNGNCCVKTKGGCVVVVPASMVNKLKDQYKGGEIVAPIVKG